MVKFLGNVIKSLNKDIYAGIVTYNPDIERLKKNLSHITEQVESVVIVDNGSENIHEIKKSIADYTNIYILCNTSNRGIAYALNRIFRWGEKNKFKWVLTLDQDSVSPLNLIECLSEFISEDTAIVAPNIIYKDNERFKEIHEIDYEYVPWAITSASLTQLKAWQKVGGFDEFLFIDKVDYDFCVRLRRHEYSIMRTYKVALDHELGALKCINFFGKTIYVTNHSPKRKYYMARNSIYLKKKLGNGSPIRDVLKMTLKILLFERNKRTNFSCVYKGILDGMLVKK